jgi:UDP-N-acetylmuramate--alanine ligase
MKKSLGKLHFIGIGGSGISGVAILSKRMGYKVTGCDKESSTAYLKNIYKGHSVSHLKGIDLAIATPAVFYRKPQIKEVAVAIKENKLITWEEFLGKHLAIGKQVICVAGTHGKSTTTAMVGKLLIDAGLDPTVVVGARIPEWKGNSRFGKGKYFVIEADEFNNNFLNYNPEYIILNNVEFDHPDFFKSEADVFDSFQKFTRRLVGKKTLIANWDNVGVRKLLSNKAGVLKVRPSKEKIKLNLKVPGEYNLSNAIMAYALGKKLGIKVKQIKKSLEGFNGIGRRSEKIADKNGVVVYDDYAHHPTAIEVTLEGIRNRYPTARIWAINEPHSFKRTKALLKHYKGVFKSADKVIIGPIFKARDSKDFGMTPELVARTTGHINAVGIKTFSKILPIIKKEVKRGDVIVVMGAGKSYVWAKTIANEISKK